MRPIDFDLTGAWWRKSSYSDGGQANCVEVGVGLPVVPVRDSKRPEGPVLAFPVAGWAAFVEGLRGA